MGGVTLERRAFAELRTKGRKLEGYAATFNVVANIGSFQERIAPNAFKEALSGDILALIDHDASKVLGRTRSGTLQLSEDSKGLAFSLDVPDTQAGRDLLIMAERQDIGGMSFGFTVPDGGEIWDGSTRTLKTINLKEISAVSAWPAYPDTEIAVRALMQGAEAQRRRRALVMAEAATWA